MDFIFSYVYRFLRRYLGVERPLPRGARTLIWMIGLYDFTFALSSVFINIFLFKEHGDWMVPGLYNLVSYATIMLAFWMGGHLSQEWSHRLSYQLGLLFNALVFLLVLILREGAPSHPCILGFLAGLGIGFYYLGQHSLTLDMTENENRDYYLSLSMFLSSIFRILAPALAGWTIQAVLSVEGVGKGSSLGYYLVFAVAFVIYLGLAYKSLQLDVKPAGGTFEFWRVLTFKGNPEWNRQMAAQFVLGLRNGLLWFAIGLLVYRVSRNEAVVGSYSMLSNFIAVLTAYALSRWATEKSRKWGMWVASLLICAGCLLLSWRIDYFSLLAYAVLNMAGTTWFQVGFGALSFRVVEKARESQERKLEYLSIRELPLMAGRMISLALFLAVQSRFGETGLRMNFLFLGFAQLVAFWILSENITGETASPLEAME